MKHRGDYYSYWATVSPYGAAIWEQELPETTLYVAHDPFAFGDGARLGRVPGLQQTRSPTASVEHSVGLGLYAVKFAAEMPHLVTREAHESPETTVMVLHVPPIASGNKRELPLAERDG